jgi:glucose-6-phosphate 1-dehydrogenase
MNKNSLPTILIILGATGDLMTKKIVPALFHLHLEKNLPKLFQVVGYSHRGLTTETFRTHLRGILEKDQQYQNASSTDVQQFLQRFVFQQGDFDKKEDYLALAKLLGATDNDWKACSNKLFYLAVPPSFLKTIVGHLAASELTKPCSPEEGWTRVLVEKPFGRDLATAEKLDELLGKLFKEEQIYRIDHYLAKEMLQNILTFRFSNTLFEKIWNNQFVEKIEIKLWETLGVEQRGPFYDGVGALRDMGQNHIMQMLALITMDKPKAFTAEAIRQERVAILKTLPRLTKQQVKQNTCRAQYGGYGQIAGVAPGSETETYFKVKTELTSPRWSGVPIMIESGKRMGEKKKEIIITFKHAAECLCPPGQEHNKNQIIFGLDPVEGITIKFWSKVPGLDFRIEERTIDFMLRREAVTSQYVEEYKKLLLDSIEGDLTLFNGTHEVREMWRFIDSIIDEWQRGATPILSYTPDTNDISRECETKINPPTVAPRRELGLVGLGKMGANLARRLTSQGYAVTAFNRTAAVTKEIEAEGIIGAYSLPELIKNIPSPRIIWLMVPAGKPVDEMLFGKEGLVPLLKKGDIIIDGGNSFYGDAAKRAAKLKKFGIHFLDCGTSGGPGGALAGPCLMIGGERKVFEKIEYLFRDLAAPSAYQFFDGFGAGHFVKMVHNGIEYGMMQALAEGFAVMKKSKFKLDLTKVTDIYNHGSVIESRLVGWLASGFKAYGENLKGISGSVNYTGEGEWTVQAAKKLKIPVPVIEDSFKFRVASQKKPSYTGQLLSTLRNQFGGHDAVHTKAIKPAPKKKK